MMMSFLGSIGSLMKGSGIEDLFIEVYAENTVSHIMSGKAVSRALRGHFLTEAGLVSLLLEQVFDDHTIESQHFNEHVTEALQHADTGNKDAFLETKLCRYVSDKLENLKLTLSGESRTAKLWILYIYYLDVLKRFIIAERTSKWLLHLDSTLRMLNLFASSGHINYAKSARMYILQMQHLAEEYPWLYEKFVAGFQAVRRSDRHWSGLWSDLAIEQTLMGSIKTHGGLTRGWGVSESVRHMWTLSLYHTSSMHRAMMDLTSMTVKTNDQHVDVTEARRKQDSIDYESLKAWLKERNPFEFADANLHSLSSGLISVAGKDQVNCDNAEQLGATIHQQLDGSSLANANIKRQDCFNSLASLFNIIKVDDKQVFLDPIVLFTRLTAIAQREDDVEKHFQFEMSPYPPCLFKDALIRKPDKPALRKMLLKDKHIVNVYAVVLSSYVLDGGALLHQVRWSKGSTNKDLAMSYVSYVRHLYNTTTIVFDGYNNPASTKTNAHARRSSVRCQDIVINESNVFYSSQEKFLSNENNKTSFITLISKYLEEDDQAVIKCDGDADTSIVSAAIRLASPKTDNPVIVVADDTDIAIMLLYHWNVLM